MEDRKLTEVELDELLGLFRNRLVIANEAGTLPDTLRGDHTDLLPEGFGDESDPYDERPDGDIIVLGNLPIQKDHLLAIAQDIGVSKSRFRFRDYNEVKNRSCRVWRDNPDIAVIFCGALPHNADGMGDASSLIAALQNDPAYPPIHVFWKDNGGLKITKTKFRETIWTLLSEGVLRQG